MRKSKSVKAKFEVEITDIQVTDRYFHFCYVVKLNGGKLHENTYDNSHNRRDDLKAFKNDLKTFYAVELAMQEAMSVYNLKYSGK